MSSADEQEENWDEVIESFKEKDNLNQETAIKNSGKLHSFALLTVLPSAILFSCPKYGLSLSSLPTIFLLASVSLLTILTLVSSYKEIALEHKKKLVKKYRSREDADCEEEAVNRSFFICNAFYLFLFLFIAFWVFPGLPAGIPAGARYAVSVYGSALLIALYNHGYLKFLSG